LDVVESKGVANWVDGDDYVVDQPMPRLFEKVENYYSAQQGDSDGESEGAVFVDESSWESFHSAKPNAFGVSACFQFGTS
jgi:hypothetical protein